MWRKSEVGWDVEIRATMLVLLVSVAACGPSDNISDGLPNGDTVSPQGDTRVGDGDPDVCGGDCPVSECGNGIPEAEEECDGGVVPNGTCSGCEIVCDPGFENCNGLLLDGCETPTDTSAADCGRCDRNCLGGSCTSGLCSAIEIAAASGTADPYLLRNAIAVDSTHVFWTSGDAVYQAEKTPASPANPIVATAQGAGDLRISSTAVYWVEVGTQAAGYQDGLVRWMPKDLSAGPSDLATGLAAPRSLSVNGGYVYWATYGTAGAFYADGAVQRSDVAGTGSPEPLWQALQGPLSVSVDGADVFWAQVGTQTADYADGKIWRANVSSLDPPALLADNQIRPRIVVVEADAIYWIGSGTLSGAGTDGNIVRLDRGTPSTPLVLLENLQFPTTLVLDGDHLYWGSENGTLWTLPKDGSSVSPEHLADDPQGTAVVGLAVDGEAIYWLNQFNNVYRTGR